MGNHGTIHYAHINRMCTKNWPHQNTTQTVYTKYIDTMLARGHHAYTQYIGSREIHVPGYVCLLDRLKIGAQLEPFSNGLSSSISNMVPTKAAV